MPRQTYLLAACERGLEVVRVQVLSGVYMLQPNRGAARHRLPHLARQGAVALLHLLLWHHASSESWG